jgi:hypothetical protein
MLLRAHLYDRRVEAADRGLAAEFARVFPTWSPVPPNVRAVIDSEYRKAGAGAPGAADARPSALRLLHDVLSKLPADVPCAIDRMTFNEDSFDLQARARSLDVAEKLAAAARTTGLDVPPPLSRRDPAGGFWTINLRGGKAQATASLAREPQ